MPYQQQNQRGGRGVIYNQGGRDHANPNYNPNYNASYNSNHNTIIDIKIKDSTETEVKIITALITHRMIVDLFKDETFITNDMNLD